VRSCARENSLLIFNILKTNSGGIAVFIVNILKLLLGDKQYFLLIL
jgi:hypothetical protein